MRNRTRRQLLLFASCLLAAGCADFKSKREASYARNPRLESNIIDVSTYSVNNPFVSFDDAGDPNPEGLRLTYYAKSGQTGIGEFADGTIRFRLIVIRRPENAEAYGEELRQWEYTPEEARGYRVKKKSIMGWGYQFRLNWGDADVYGSEIRVVPEFERRDGRIVRGMSRSFLVPRRQYDIQIRPASIRD